MDEHASRQLATAILKHIPKKLRELVDFEVGLQAGVFPILGALYYPHLGEDAIERQILADTQLVTGTGSHQRGVEHRHEVYAHLIRWMAAVKRLTAAGQKPSDINSRQGLQAIVSRCHFDHEMAQFERDVRRDRKVWNTAIVLEELINGTHRVGLRERLTQSHRSNRRCRSRSSNNLSRTSRTLQVPRSSLSWRRRSFWLWLRWL